MESDEISKKESILTICYDKRYIIITGVIIILLLLYIYYCDVKILLPTGMSTFLNRKFKNKSSSSSYDEIDDLKSNDDWVLEDEINNYMELQDDYIANL